jgi:uncharacterized protein (DUF2147 family)|tara:strand:+ start:1162 stop:1626 length:465 start_codon:yes stop_codon:yes gene_type:complete
MKTKRGLSGHILVVMLLLCAFSVKGQQVIGQWKTIDDETKKERSVVEIYKVGDRYAGKIIKLVRGLEDDPDPLCEACSSDDPRYLQKIIGMEIIQDMTLDLSSNEYVDGTILDPESGSEYHCKLWLSEDGSLKVRGYIAFFYRTQTWLPVPTTN